MTATGRRLRLLLYTHALTGGGAERVWATLAARLAERGHAVTLAYDADAAGVGPAIDPRVRLLCLGRNHAAAILRLARHLAVERPDVSVSALGVSNLKHVLAALAVGRHRRAVISFHGHPSSEPEGLSWLGNRATPLLSRLTARSVFVSEGLRAHYRDALRASPARSVRIHNPVETEAAVPAESAEVLRGRPRTVLAVGRLVPAKDFAMLLRAFTRVRSDARLVIVGDGPERGALQAQIDALGLRGRVALAGAVNRPWRFYREAACFASSSRSEAFGNVIVEALAHGLPVAATACDGPSEILAEGRFGTMVPIGDAAALAAAIDALLADPGDPAPRIRRADDFATQVAVDRYEALFRDMLAERGA